MGLSTSVLSRTNPIDGTVWLRFCTLTLFAVLTGCAARVPPRRHIRQAVTIRNDGPTMDICRVRVRPAGAQNWADLGSMDPLAPGRSRTLRLPHGRWSFRFEACEYATVFDSPPIDVSFTRVVFLLCDGVCRSTSVPAGALIIRHNAEGHNWGITGPVFVPTGRHRSRLVL